MFRETQGQGRAGLKERTSITGGWRRTTKKRSSISEKRDTSQAKRLERAKAVKRLFTKGVIPAKPLKKEWEKIVRSGGVRLIVAILMRDEQTAGEGEAHMAAPMAAHHSLDGSTQNTDDWLNSRSCLGRTPRPSGGEELSTVKRSQREEK